MAVKIRTRMAIHSDELTSLLSLQKRYIQRRQERGAALFIVVLVLTMLAGLGMFAVRTTSLVDLAAGYDRQANQADYAGEFAAKATSSHLTGSENAYHSQAAMGLDTCRSNGLLNALPGLARRNCRILTSQTIWSEVATFKPAIAGPITAPTLLGDLGTNINGSFRVELTEAGRAYGVVGSNAGPSSSGTTMKFMQSTMSIEAYVHPTGVQGSTCTDVGTPGAAVSRLRSHIIYGPIAAF